MRLKKLLKQIPGLAKTVRWLGLRSPSDWLYQRTVVKGVYEAGIRDQLPGLYRLFASYCELYLGLTRVDRVYGAKLMFSVVSKLQRLISDKTSAYLRIGSIDAFLDQHDPRFLEVVNELSLKSHTDTRVLPALLAPGDTFVDIGANQGSYSLVAAQIVGDTGRVVAVEPQPHLAKNIERSLQRSGVGEFDVYPTAVGDRDGTVELLVPRSYSGTAGVYRNHSGLHRHGTLRVPIRRFDDLANWSSFRGSVLLKLDVEGGEIAFLRGAGEMLTTLRPNLLLEVNPNPLRAAGVEVDDLVAVLKELGYTSYRHTDRLTTFHALESLQVTGHENIVVSARTL